MFSYLLRRLFLLPVTLFCIVLVNFIIINMAPGDPVTVTEVSQEGAATRKEDRSVAFGSDDRYLQFREFYGLTLPIVLNTWPWLSFDDVHRELWSVVNHRESPSSAEKLSFKDYDALRILLGDQARFVMPDLLNILKGQNEAMDILRAGRHAAGRPGPRPH
jgi:peptide/nickel transport system permease protein